MFNRAAKMHWRVCHFPPKDTYVPPAGTCYITAPTRHVRPPPGLSPLPARLHGTVYQTPNQWSFRGERTLGNAVSIVSGKCLRMHYGRHCEQFFGQKCTQTARFSYTISKLARAVVGRSYNEMLQYSISADYSVIIYDSGQHASS